MQERLEKYAQLLLKWNAKINLIAKSTEAELWQRHIHDSLAIAPHIPASTNRLIDLGSGGGLPAIPLAIATGLPVHMVESDQRKATFLRQCLRELGLAGEVCAERIENAKLTNCFGRAIITARALSEVKNILDWANSLVAKNNLQDYALFLLKGENVSRETFLAEEVWQIESEVCEIDAKTKANLLKIYKFSERGGK